MSKSTTRLLALFLVGVALVLEILENIIHWVHGSFSYVELGFFIFIFVLCFLLVVALVKKDLKATAFLLASLKVFDSVFYSMKFFQRIDSNTLSGLAGACTILMGISALVLFTSFIIFMIEKVFEIKWCDRGIRITLLVASALMFAASIINLVDYSKYGKNWIIVLEPFAVSILFLGLFFSSLYLKKEYTHMHMHAHETK